MWVILETNLVWRMKSIFSNVKWDVCQPTINLNWWLVSCLWLSAWGMTQRQNQHCKRVYQRFPILAVDTNLYIWPESRLEADFLNYNQIAKGEDRTKCKNYMSAWDSFSYETKDRRQYVLGLAMHETNHMIDTFLTS